MFKQGGAASAAPGRHSPEPRLWRKGARAWALAFTLVISHPTLAEEPKPLDLATALALARKNNPALDAVRRRVEEARGELTAASVLLPENPELDLGVGPRLLDPGASGNLLALEAGLSQRFEIACQRGHRMGRARAEVVAAEAEAEAAARALDLAVATSFWQALAARERSGIARQHHALARELLDIAKARYERGATSPLELNGARIRLKPSRRHGLAGRAGRPALHHG